MRDEHDYASMGPVELREHLDRVAKELASWLYAVADQKKERHYTFLEAYAQSNGKSVAERRMDAEMATASDQKEIIENEGLVAFYTTIRDMIVVLLTADV